jgi:hypothetical protein
MRRAQQRLDAHLDAEQLMPDKVADSCGTEHRERRHPPRCRSTTYDTS